MYSEVLLRVELVGDDAAAAVHETEFAAMMFPGAVGVHQAHEQRGEVAEDLDLLLVGFEGLLEQVQAAFVVA